MRYLLTRLRTGLRRRRDLAFCEACAGVCSPEWRRESRLAAYHKAALDARLLRSTGGQPWTRAPRLPL